MNNFVDKENEYNNEINAQTIDHIFVDVLKPLTNLRYHLLDAYLPLC